MELSWEYTLGVEGKKPIRGEEAVDGAEQKERPRLGRWNTITNLRKRVKKEKGGDWGESGKKGK